ncbi:MAG: hypothetical protein JSR71_09215 [Proteobacteria bacterium]|nr:hypothetical protein [Pseudomonadota bacterium]
MDINKPMEVTFKFPLKRGVITPFGANGYIDMCAVDRGGNTYLVITENGKQWFDEEDLAWPDEA